MARKKTGIIRYNVGNRGRKLIGQARDFNVPRLVALINSPQVQELVNSGDMYGYLGHGVREEWGFRPQEMVLNKQHGSQEYVVIEPAIRTIHLKAYEDGTIEHEEEFLDNSLGRKAHEWFEAKIGGFSSVITPTMHNPTNFYGFDYVMIPNFATNRGFEMVMDSAFMDVNRLTSKQKAEWLQARDIERRVILDSVREKFIQLQGDLMIADQVVASEESQRKQLQGVLDDVSFQLREAQSRLKRLEVSVKPEPMLKLNTGPYNWLDQSQAVMDSVLQDTQDEKIQQALKSANTQDDWTPLDNVRIY